MGTFVEGLRANGDSGHSYRFRRLEQVFDDESMEAAKAHLMAMGHVPVMTTFEHSAQGSAGLIKIQPEMTNDEIHLFSHETGLVVESPEVVV